MQVRHREVFTSIQTEGAILPPDLLKRIFSGDSDLDGLKSKDYHLSEGEKLNEAINRSWNVLQGYWRSFLTGKEKLAEGDLGTTLTRERWLLPLFQELGYGRLLTHKAIDIESKTYPISHIWHQTPIHLVGYKVDLDRRMAKVAGAARSSPHSLVQELLNRSNDYLWAFLSNGIRLRILRDNLSLTRQAYIEFDLETMMEGEIYSDFVLLWLLCHQSRVEANKPEEFWLEKWSRTAQEQGTRALDQLRDGVEDALKALGSGFLKHPLNRALREKLKAGQLDKQDYYRQILRLIYRLLFLFVAEDRDMLFDPDSKPEDRELYTEHYSTTRLRRRAEKFRGTRHSDLYQGFRLISEKLGDYGCSELGLPALGSFLFSKEKALPDLDNSEISNENFLGAIRALAFTLDQGTLRAVDYKNLGSEEFGSVYESLLELHPNLNADAGTFELEVAGGHERKTTGSYYTPSSLVQCLLGSALDPVIDAATKEPDPEQAILGLKICDPASGSGHFLIAAAHRIARRLAALRTGDEEPAPEAVRTALRDVIGHCIYGVDLNPMAVELCKVALWMESLDPGKPLSFLDHKIKCGNSLLGTTPKLMADGIPNETFKPIKGDDPKYCSVLRRRNDQERRGQMTMWATMIAESHAAYGSLSDRYRTLDEMDDASVKAIAEKEKQYGRLLQSSNYQRSKLIADAWCAAFVWPKRTDAQEPVTQDIFRQIQSFDLQPLRETVAEVHELSERYRFFHWHLAFPDVFRVPSDRESAENEQEGWNGGFSVVLGNPPWELIKIQEKEWFAEKAPEIANAPNTAIRRRMIEKQEGENPALFNEFNKALRQAEGESHLIRNSSKFPLCGRGDVNTFSIFAETNRMIVSHEGRVGCIVPSGIATDDTTKFFFQDLMKKQSLVSLYDFENRRKLFPTIDSRMKFCLLTLTGASRPASQGADFVFFALSLEDLDDIDRHFELSSQEIELLNPNTHTCPIFRRKIDAVLTKVIYRRFPVLIKEGPPEENPWGISFSAMLHMANDSHLFQTASQLEEEGYHLEGNIYIRGSDKYLPLYEAKMIHHFNHRFGDYRDHPPGSSSTQLPEITPERLKDPNYVILPRYWAPEKEVYERLEGKWDHNWLLGWRNITNTTNERTVIASVLPRAGIGHSFPIFFSKEKSFKLLVFLTSLSSFPLDYVARQKLGGTNLTYGYLMQLPIIDPEQFENVYLNLSFEMKHLDMENNCTKSNKILSLLFSHGMELAYTAWDLQGFAQDCGYGGPPFRWDEERRFLLRCELDAAFFHIYLPSDQNNNWLQSERESPDELSELKKYFPNPRHAVDYIMETFPIIKRKDIQKYSEYRTKLTILDIYKCMQHAIESGEPYQTLLDPPPADPSVGHLPKDGCRQPGSIWHLSDLLHSTPTKSSTFVQIPEEYLVEGIDSSGLSKFRILKEDERMIRECQVVIIRHPELLRGDEKVKIAAGKFYWVEQRDVQTGKAFILITLRTKGAPVRLKLSKEEWKQFQPLAVLEK